LAGGARDSIALGVNVAQLLQVSIEGEAARRLSCGRRAGRAIRPDGGTAARPLSPDDEAGSGTPIGGATPGQKADGAAGLAGPTKIVELARAFPANMEGAERKAWLDAWHYALGSRPLEGLVTPVGERKD
jgi:hypothetical protein